MALVIVILFIIFIVVLTLLSYSAEDTARQNKIKFINQYLSRSLIIQENPTTDSYLINLPIEVFGLYRNEHQKYRVNFKLIYLEIRQGNFKMGKTHITYDLQELYIIFKQAVEEKIEPIIYINLRERRLRVYSDKNPKIGDIRYLKSLHNEFTNLDIDIQKLDKEIEKVESLIKAVQGSELYNYQINTYQKGLNLLMDSKSKAIIIKSKYFQFLRDRILSFYLDDVGFNMFNFEDKETNWEIKYKSFTEDYDLLKTMMEEYNKLKSDKV